MAMFIALASSAVDDENDVFGIVYLTLFGGAAVIGVNTYLVSEVSYAPLTQFYFPHDVDHRLLPVPLRCGGLPELDTQEPHRVYWSTKELPRCLLSVHSPTCGL